MRFHPYLTFEGTCAEAFGRYQEVFGGPLEVITMAEAPDGPPDDVDPEQVMHAALSTDGGAVLMGPDRRAGDPTGRPLGMLVTVELPTKEEAHRVFDDLAEGGAVHTPIGETFFSPAYGICVDRFGTPWLVMAGTMPGE
jgi:PhnB protein